LILAEPLAHIHNLSLLHGVVPNDLKSTRGVPLYNKSDFTAVGNYRPVSILSVFPKYLKELFMTKYIHILLIPNYFMNFNLDLEVIVQQILA